MLIWKMFNSSAFVKSDIRTFDVSHSSKPTSETTRKAFTYISYHGQWVRREEELAVMWNWMWMNIKLTAAINVSVDRTWLSIQQNPRVSNRGFVSSEIIKSCQSLLLYTHLRHFKVWSIKICVLLNVNEWANSWTDAYESKCTLLI